MDDDTIDVTQTFMNLVVYPTVSEVFSFFLVVGLHDYQDTVALTAADSQTLRCIFSSTAWCLE